MGEFILFSIPDTKSSIKMSLHTFLLLNLAYSDGGWCDRTGKYKWFHDRTFDLIDAVNDYRRQNGRPILPCDSVLVETAYRHTVSQIEKPPRLSPSSKCSTNGHSWLSSNKQGFSRLKPCCYDNNPRCMWNKPNELRKWYTGKGYEVTVWMGVPELSADDALEILKNSRVHRNVILGNGRWGRRVKRIGCFRNQDW